MSATEIRDSRSKGWFYLDNELLEVFGGKSKEDKGIGIHAIGVYMVLAKHANNDTQQCKPSYQTIANLLGVSRNTVITAIKTLEQSGLVSVEQRISHEKNKPTTTNIYTLKNIKTANPIPASEPPSARDGLGVVQEMVYPSAPEVPELYSLNKTSSNKTSSSSSSTTRPPKSEAVLIEEYFLKATTGSIGFMSAMQREVCKKLADEGMTVDRCQPGIDQTIAEMNDKHKTVGSIQLCLAAIYQLDPAKPKPTLITSYQKTAPFEAPKKTFNEEDQRLTPKQQQILDEKRAQFQADEAAAAERRERRRLEKLALAQPINEPIRLQA